MFWANQITACISENLQSRLMYYHFLPLLLLLLSLLLLLLLLLSLATIQASSSGTINGNDFTISVSANVAGEFECSLDGASFQSCSYYITVLTLLLSMTLTLQAQQEMYFQTYLLVHIP